MTHGPNPRLAFPLSRKVHITTRKQHRFQKDQIKEDGKLELVCRIEENVIPYHDRGTNKHLSFHEDSNLRTLEFVL